MSQPQFAGLDHPRRPPAPPVGGERRAKPGALQVHDAAGVALAGELDIGVAAVWLRGDTTAARTRIGQALRRTPLASLPVSDRPYLDAVIALATAGDAAPAERLLDEYRQRVDTLDQRRNRPREHHARGGIASH